MNTCARLDKNVTSLSDVMESLLGKIVIATHGNFCFSARLIDLRDGTNNDQELWFESKKGTHWMVRRSQLTGIRLVKSEEGEKPVTTSPEKEFTPRWRRA